MPTRLLAVDLDGTLLTKDRLPHPENIEAIKRATEAGMLVVPASGRISANIHVFLESLGLDRAMICCNGAHVQGPDGDLLLHVGLPEEAIEITFAYMQKSGVHINAYTREDVFFFADSEWEEVYRKRVRAVKPEKSTVEQVREMSLLKLILIDHPPEIQRHRAELDACLSPELAILTESEPEYLEVLSPSANKGLGLKALSEALGIPQGETAAIGDYLNDLEMIQWAGIGAAVANAIDEVKAVADIEMPSNEDAGVARFIDYLLARNAYEQLQARPA